jgi:hypothetical protein
LTLSGDELMNNRQPLDQQTAGGRCFATVS